MALKSRLRYYNTIASRWPKYTHSYIFHALFNGIRFNSIYGNQNIIIIIVKRANQLAASVHQLHTDL